MKLPSKLAEQRDELSLKQHIYETKYGGKDHSGYDTKMLYEINYDREEAFDIGFNKACEILLPQLEKMKKELEVIEDCQSDICQRYAKKALRSYREVMGDE